MDQLPIFFQIKGKSVAVAGGGTVAARRAELALRAGAKVKVFSETLSDDFRALPFREFSNMSPALSRLPTCRIACSLFAQPATLPRTLRLPAREAGAGSYKRC